MVEAAELRTRVLAADHQIARLALGRDELERRRLAPVHVAARRDLVPRCWAASWTSLTPKPSTTGVIQFEGFEAHEAV
jgi:hypothetical protein